MAYGWIDLMEPLVPQIRELAESGKTTPEIARHLINSGVIRSFFERYNHHPREIEVIGYVRRLTCRKGISVRSAYSSKYARDEERKRAYQLRETGASYRSIARELGVAPATARANVALGERIVKTGTRLPYSFDGESVGVRLYNVLMNSNLSSWAEVSAARGELRRIPNLGRKTYNEISEILESRGFDPLPKY